MSGNKPDAVAAYLHRMETQIRDPLLERLSHRLAVVESKATGLLGHISIMIAIVAIFLVEGFGSIPSVRDLDPTTASIIENILRAELSIYVMCALMCLFAVGGHMPTRRSDDVEVQKRGLAHAIISRRRLYNLAYAVSIVVTVGFVITIWVRYWLTDYHVFQ